MKQFILWGFLLASQFVFAESSTGFKLLTTNCKPTLDQQVDSAPQSPPLMIDDPATPGCNTWEINLTFTGELNSAEKVFQAPLLDLNYGIGDNLQLKFEMARTLTQSTSDQKAEYSRPKIGLKYLFYDDDMTKLQVSFYPQIEFSNPLQGGLNEAFRAGSSITWPLLLSKKISESKLGDIILAVNLGYTQAASMEAGDSGYFRIGLGLPVLHDVAWMSEVGAVQSFSRAPYLQENSTQFNTGVLVGLSKSVRFYASCGQEFSSSVDKNTFSILAGFRLVQTAF